MLKKLLLIPLLLSATITNATYTTVPVTGFNEDLIANGSGPASGSVSLATGFDGSNYAFVSQDFSGGSSAPTYYLPTTGTLNSLITSGLTYQLASYSGSNVLHLVTSGSSGTLVFNTPQSGISRLYILGTSGSGTSTFDVTVNYVGGTSTTFSSKSYVDWYNGTAAVTGVGRVNTTNNTYSGSSATAPRLYQISLDVSANYGGLVQSVTFTKTSSTGLLGIMAISADDAICNGLPNAGTASAPAGVCANANFNLTSTGYTTDPGVTFQWQSSPSGAGNWTDISGATTVTYTVTGGISSATDYQLVATCINGGAVSISNTVTVGLTLCYCTPTYTNGCSSWKVTNVTCGSFVHNPGTCTTHDYTAQSFSLIAGVSTAISVTTTGYVAMGIAADFNIDGDFDDMDEAMSLPTYIATSPATYAVNITVPATVTPGNYRLRIWCRLANSGNGTPADSPCGTYGYGTYVDYTINVLSSSTCTGQPAIPVASGPVSVCPNTSFNLTTSGGTQAVGITYQWQSSPSGAGNWTDIIGATDANYTETAGIAANTDYQLITTCTNGGATSTSNIVTVPLAVCYCSPTYTSGCTNWRVTNVTQGAFNNSPSGSCTTSNYLAQTMSIAAGSTVPMDVTTTGYVAMGVAADFSLDGDFDDVDEVLSLPVYIASSPATYSVNITIPATVTPGTYRMRIWCRLANSGNGTPADSPCGTYGYGNFIDYTLDVTSVLDIKLNDITAVNAGAQNRISWRTATEDHGDHFELERSADGKTYTTIYTVAANGIASAYYYNDREPSAGVNYYRLKMTDAAGKAAYSRVVIATVKDAGSFTLEAWPNPVTETLTLTLRGIQGEMPKITISDIAGRIFQPEVQFSGNQIMINMKNMAQGVYIIKYNDELHSQAIRVNKK